LFSCKTLREFRYSHARRHAFKNPDFMRSAVAHELFWLPLTASCARAGERAPNRRFVLFAAKTSFTVVVVVKDDLLGLLCRIFTQILGRFDMFCEPFIRCRWLSRSIELPLKFGKHWIPETIFLKYTELTKVVLAGKASFICEFRLHQYKSDLARIKPRDAIFVLVFRVFSIVRVTHAWRTMMIYSPREKTGTSHLRMWRLIACSANNKQAVLKSFRHWLNHVIKNCSLEYS